jgi:hypothetical protein
MQAYKTTPDNISDLLSFQINMKEEGILLTSKEFNVFLPDYTARMSEILDNLIELMDSMSENLKPALNESEINPELITELIKITGNLKDIKEQKL